MSEQPTNHQRTGEQLNGFHIPSSEEVLSERLNGTHITLKQGDSFSTGFLPSYNRSSSNSHTQSSPVMDRTIQQQDIPDRLLNQFSPNKRPEDKPFSYIPSGGIAELQQRSTSSVRQREVAPSVKPKPKAPNRQTSFAGSESSQTSYNPASLFTPAYREMVKSQQEMLSQPLPAAVPSDMVGFGPGKIPQEQVAAYILQPDGTMAALRPNQQPGSWNDRPGPDLQNSAVMAALMEEQNAQMQGRTSGRIHNTGSGNRQGLSFKVLQWLTGTDSEDGSETASNYSGSHDGQYMTSPTSRRVRQQSFDTHRVPDKIREESPASSEGKPRSNRLKIISRGESQDKQASDTQQQQRQLQPQERVAYCDF